MCFTISAILFLYREALHKETEPIHLSNAKCPEHFTFVFAREGVFKVISNLIGTHRLISQPMVGSNLRLHVKEIDFGNDEIPLRDGSGDKTASHPYPIASFDIRTVHELLWHGVALGCGLRRGEALAST